MNIPPVFYIIVVIIFSILVFNYGVLSFYAIGFIILTIIILFSILSNKNQEDQTSVDEKNIPSKKEKIFQQNLKKSIKKKEEERKKRYNRRIKKLEEQEQKRQERLNKKNKSNKNKVTKKNIKKKTLSSSNKEEFYAAIDFETANNSGSSACEIGYALFTRKKIIESDSRLIQPPDKHFNSYFTNEIHHISWEDVQYEPTFDEVWNEIYPIIQDVKFIAAHNASFDKNVLKECCDYYNIAFPRKKFVCTYRNISNKLWSFENNKLPTVCRHLKIPLDHHKGKSDAEACAKIVIKGFKEGWNYE